MSSTSTPSVATARTAAAMTARPPSTGTVTRLVPAWTRGASTPTAAERRPARAGRTAGARPHLDHVAPGPALQLAGVPSAMTRPLSTMTTRWAS